MPSGPPDFSGASLALFWIGVLFPLIGSVCFLFLVIFPRSYDGELRKIEKFVWLITIVLFSIYMVVASTAVGSFALMLTTWILLTVSQPFFSFLACGLGLILFRLRGTRPAAYGTLEIVVAVVALNVASQSENPDELSRLVAIAGGIYIFVRGLDNIEKGLPYKIKPIWFYLFPKLK